MEPRAMEPAARPVSGEPPAEEGVTMTREPELSVPQKTAPGSTSDGVKEGMKMGGVHNVRKEIPAKKDRLEPLKIDMTKHIPIPPTSAQLSLQCLECHIIFSDHKSKERHLKLSHPAEYEQCMLGDALFACYVCDSHFTCSSDLMAHQRAHTEKQPFKCPICGEAFRRSSELTLHKKVHFGLHGYTCSDCGKPCKTLTLLKYHRRTHTGERPYVCKDCGKRFSMSKALQKHLLTHSQEDVEGVSGGTVLLSPTSDTTHIKKLIAHTASAQGKPPVTFSCSLCNVMFKTAKTRLQHMKLKHSQGRDPAHNNITPRGNHLNEGQPVETQAEAFQPLQPMVTFGQEQTLQQIETLGQEQMQELIETLGQEQLMDKIQIMGHEQIQVRTERVEPEETEAQTEEIENTQGQIVTLELEQIQGQIKTLGPEQTQGEIKTLEQEQTEGQGKTIDVEQTQLQIETLELQLTPGQIETMVLQQTQGNVQMVHLQQSDEQLKAMELGQTHLQVDTLVLEPTHPEMETVELELTQVPMETLELEQAQVQVETVELELTQVHMETLELEQTQAQMETVVLEQTQEQIGTAGQVEREPLKERKAEEETLQQIEVEDHRETCQKPELNQQVSENSLGQIEQMSTQVQEIHKPVCLSSIQAKEPEQNTSQHQDSQPHTLKLQPLPKHTENAHIQQCQQEKPITTYTLADFVKGGHRTKSKKISEGQLTKRSHPVEHEKELPGLCHQGKELTQHPETQLKAKRTKQSRLKKDHLVVRFIAPEKVKQSKKQKPLLINPIQQKDVQGKKLQKIQNTPHLTQTAKLQQKAAKEKRVKKQEVFGKPVNTQTLLRDKIVNHEVQQMPQAKEQKQQMLLKKKKEQIQKSVISQKQPEQQKEATSRQIQKKKRQGQVSRKVQLMKKEELPPKRKIKKKQEKVQKPNKQQAHNQEDKEQIQQQSLLLLKGHKQPQLKVHKLDPSKTQGQPHKTLPCLSAGKQQQKPPLPVQKRQKITKTKQQKKKPNQKQQKVARQPKRTQQQAVPLLPLLVPPSSSSVVQIKSRTNRKRKASSAGAAETTLGSPQARRALGCEHCGERFSEILALEEHLAAVHAMGIRPGECNSNGNVSRDISRTEGDTLGLSTKRLTQRATDRQLDLTSVHESEMGKTLALENPGRSCLQKREGEGVKVVGVAALGTDLSLTLDLIQPPKSSDAVLGNTMHPDNFGIRVATDWDMEVEMGEIGLGDRVERVSFPALNPSPSLSLAPTCLESEGKERGAVSGESFAETMPKVTSDFCTSSSGHSEELKAQQGEESVEDMKGSRHCAEETSQDRVLSGTQNTENCVLLDGAPSSLPSLRDPSPSLSKSSQEKPMDAQNHNQSPLPSPTKQLEKSQPMETTTKEGQVEGRQFDEKNQSDGNEKTSSGLQVLTSGPEPQRVTEEEIKEELLLDVDIVTIGDQSMENNTLTEDGSLAFNNIPQASHTASCQLQVESIQSSQRKSKNTPTLPTQVENPDLSANENAVVVPFEIKQEEEEVEVERREGGRRRVGKDNVGRSRRKGRGGNQRGGKKRVEVDIMNETESEGGTEGCQVVLQVQPLTGDSQIKEEEGVGFYHRSRSPSLRVQEEGGSRCEQEELVMNAGISESCLPASLEESSDEQIVFELESVTTSVEVLKTEEGMEEEEPGEQGSGARDCRSPSVLLERFLTGRERDVGDMEQCRTEERNNRLMDHAALGFGVEADLRSGADGMALMGALRGQVIKVEEYSSDLMPCQNASRDTLTRDRGAVVNQQQQQQSGVQVFLVKEEDPLVLDEPQAFQGHRQTELTVEEMGPECNTPIDLEAISLEDREVGTDGNGDGAAGVSPLVIGTGVGGERCIVLQVKEEEREMALEPPQREHGLSVLLVSSAPGLDQQAHPSQTEEGSLVSDLHSGPFADSGGFWVPVPSGCGTEEDVRAIEEHEEEGERSIQMGTQQNMYVRTGEGELNTGQQNTDELLEFLMQMSDAEYSDSSDSEPDGEAFALARYHENRSRSRGFMSPDEMSRQKRDHQKSNLSAQEGPVDSVTEGRGRGVQEKRTPIEYFCQYLDWAMWDEIAQCNSTLSDTLHSVTAKEVAQFVGIHIAMGTLKFPDMKLYWQDLTKVPLIADAMPASRFTLLTRKLRLARQAGNIETPRDTNCRATTEGGGSTRGDRDGASAGGASNQLNTRNSNTEQSGFEVGAHRSDITSSVRRKDFTSYQSVPSQRLKDGVSERRPGNSQCSSQYVHTLPASQMPLHLQAGIARMEDIHNIRSHSHYRRRRVQALGDTHASGDRNAMPSSFSNTCKNAQRPEDMHNSKNSSLVNDDSLWKVRPLLERVRAGCLGVSREGSHGVDQYPLLLGRHQRSKSLKNPCPALQCTVLVGTGGFVLDFNLSVDESNREDTVQKMVPRNQENGEGAVFICKEELCTPSVLERLLVAGVRGAGRVAGVRGGFGDEFLSSDGRLTLLRCHQGFILSSLRKRQARPFSLIRDFERAEKDIQFNRDLQNLYRTPLLASTPATWPHSVLWHVIDLALVNSWLQFRQDHSDSHERLNFMAFRLEVAKALILSDGTDMPQSTPPHPPAPKLPSQDSVPPPAAVPAVPLPDATTRYDGLGHWPEQLAEGEEARCRFGGCERMSRVRCLKCCVFLCISRNHNCFIKFHSQGGI